MRVNNVLGIIFSNTNDETIKGLTDRRAMGSVPFFGKYRLIDFVLSNMVNSGISKVGVITQNNYQSLMDHIGSGKQWDLSRKNNGLYILPPFSYGLSNGTGTYKNVIDSLNMNQNFIRKSDKDYIVITDCDVVCNIDLEEVVNYHISKGSDITIVHKKGQIPTDMANPLTLDMDENGKVTQILYNDHTEKEESHYSMKMYVIGKDLLLKLITDCVCKNCQDFDRDILQCNVDKLNIFGYEFTGFTVVINSIKSYYNAHMSLTDSKLRAELFDSRRPIYTKVRDVMPARYGLDCNINNSIIADGCIIEGEVNNSVLFREVKVGKGTKINNSIILQGAEIGANCNLTYVITDKDVTVLDDQQIVSPKTYPAYIAKNSIV